MVSLCTGVLGEEGRVNISLSKKLCTEYLFTFTLAVTRLMSEVMRESMAFSLTCP